MSFASDCKNEISTQKIERKCCALAECYGVLLFCKTFSSGEIRITTASDGFAERLPKLFKKAFGLSFDILPEEGKSGKRSFVINDGKKIRSIFEAFYLDADMCVSHHINLAVLEEECDRVSFVRGAFLAGGAVTDPEKSYHLEMTTTHDCVSRELVSILLDLGLNPKLSSRAGIAIVYFKQADAIAELLAIAGAKVNSMKVMTAKVEKEMRNTITRQINCDSANADKTVAAAQEQINAIRSYGAAYGLDSLPEELNAAALLRITNPDVSLSDLAKLSYPPVTKSCLSHRLKKIMELAKEINA